MPKHFPPGPKDALLGLRLLNRMRRQPLEFAARLVRTYGDMVFLRMGPYRVYLVVHPDVIREVLVTKWTSFQKMGRLRRAAAPVEGIGLVYSEEETWLRQRRLAQPAFYPHRMAGYARAMVERTERLLDRWEVSAGEPKGDRVDVFREMARLATENIAKALFNVDVSGA